MRSVGPASSVRCALLLLALALAACGGEAPTADASRPPNVLLVSIDTLRADRLGSYGYGRGTTPFLDRLAAEGARFTDCSAPSSKTASSHMSMLSGVHPGVHGVRNCYTPETAAASPDLPLAPEAFRAAGYRTAAFTGGGMMTHELGFSRGFESYDDAGGGADRVFPKVAAWARAYAEGEGGGADPRPFFLFVHTYEVHDPYTPPAEWVERFAGGYQGSIDATRVAMPEDAAELWKTDPGFYEEIQRRFWGGFRGDRPADVQHMSDLYDAGIAYTDALLAELWAELEGLGLTDDLVVVLTSDHGDEFNEHGAMTHQTLYQGVLHVPLLVRVPGTVPAGLRIDHPVQGVDLAPSLLDLAGLPPLGGAGVEGRPQGRSWVPLLAGTPPSGAPSVWSELGTPNNEEASLRLGSLKLIGHRIERRFWLFDLATDPGERQDLVLERPEDAARLSERLLAQEQANRVLAPAYPVVPVRLGQAARGALDALGYTGGDEDQ